MSPLVRLENLQQFTAVNVLSDPGQAGGPVIIPSCAQIKLFWGVESGKAVRTILYGRYSGAFAGTQTQANAIHTALVTDGAWTALAAFFATSTTLGGVSIRNVALANQAEIVSNTASGAGTSASAALPSEVNVVVTLRTALAGQSGRGRLYVPGFATNGLGTGNVVAAACVTALNNWAATISGAFSAQGYTWVLGLRQRVEYIGSTGTLHPARAATSVPITTASLRNNTWDSQRRRGLK